MQGLRKDVAVLAILTIPVTVFRPESIWNAGCSLMGAMTQKPYDFRERSFLFACDVVAFARIVADRGYILARLATQLVDAGGSIGANLEESASGQSKPDFIAKQCIALKESREARFWLRLIAASEPPLDRRAQPLIAEASEFVAMLTTSVKNARSNPNRGHEA